MKIFFVILLVSCCWMACTARRMPASSQASAEVEHGRDKYMQYCQKCHPMGESGLGPALNNSPAPGFVKRFQVRHGLGAMPAFKKDVISKADLHDIMRYMKSMKREEKLPS
ncbi:c-type cytochrome [Chitinophaga cymbidii]|nr:cytochrome c [Chitinophaga cymbidii]